MEALGANRVRIVESVSSFSKASDPAYLEQFGDLVSFGFLPVGGSSETDQSLRVIAMNDADWRRLAKRFPSIPSYAPVVISSGLLGVNSGDIKVNIGGQVIQAAAIGQVEDSIFSILPDSVIVSYRDIPGSESLSHQRHYVVDSKDPDSISTAYNDWLLLQGINSSSFDYNDASTLKKQLDQFRETKALALLGLAGMIGFLIIAVYMACSVLEFKQSNYVVCLMRSFGVPGSLLLAQRVIENLIFILISFGLGLGMALGLAVSNLEITHWLLYNERGILAIVFIFCCGIFAAVAGTLPVLLYLRVDPGKVLK